MLSRREFVVSAFERETIPLRVHRNQNVNLVIRIWIPVAEAAGRPKGAE